MSLAASGSILAALLLLSFYGAYVAVLVVRAEFYTRGQKIAQTLLALFVPLAGPLVVHAFLRQHRARPEAPDRAFIAQQELTPDELRRFHRPPDEPGG